MSLKLFGDYRPRQSSSFPGTQSVPPCKTDAPAPPRTPNCLSYWVSISNCANRVRRTLSWAPRPYHLKNDSGQSQAPRLRPGRDCQGLHVLSELLLPSPWALSRHRRLARRFTTVILPSTFAPSPVEDWEENSHRRHKSSPPVAPVPSSTHCGESKALVTWGTPAVRSCLRSCNLPAPFHIPNVPRIFGRLIPIARSRILRLAIPEPQYLAYSDIQLAAPTSPWLGRLLHGRHQAPNPTSEL